MSCENESVTLSFETGAAYDSSAVGLAEPPTAASAPPVPSGLEAFACSAAGSENEPLTRWPVAVELGSATLSAASPAVEMTLAVVPAVYVLPRPGVNAPNEAGVPSESESVAGTVPPGLLVCDVAPSST